MNLAALLSRQRAVQSIEQKACDAEYGAQWRSKFMSHVRKKSALQFGPPQKPKPLVFEFGIERGHPLICLGKLRRQTHVLRLRFSQSPTKRFNVDRVVLFCRH